VNSFGEGECHNLQDLASGALLFKCMRNVLPDLACETEQKWSALLLVLTEFCGCPLDQSVSRELLEAGDEEHLARAVVLLLCLAVQRKPNEDVISRITTLPYKAQCDIMFFIEEALAKMKSNALSSGLFTSGVGDVVPALSGTNSVEREEGDNESINQGQEKGERGEATEINGCGPTSLVSTPQPTPNRLPKLSSIFALSSSVPRSVSRQHVSRSSYYEGLESPAAVQWMQSQKKRSSHLRRHGRSNGPSSPEPAEQLPEEVLKLQHRVRVLERSLLNEQTLSQEMHAALCQREREIHELEVERQKAQAMAERARELADVQDELQTAEKALEKSEKNAQRLQREAEEQRASQSQEIEQKMTEIGCLETESSQLKELLEKAVAEQLEQKSEVKRLQLSGETAAIAFQAKQQECDSLLQLNQEVT
jgi:hypothetical protein